ncbi:MAG TPA: pyridoxal phosphate-dependent aminotransferase [Thermoplasmata archaeon]|nr:pyridoxal phosphate-dependent aminotransferase [Thermoplasmata archaeon]
MASAPPFDAFRYAHEHRTEVVWMSQNTNHLVPPEHTRAAVEAALTERVYEGYPYAPGLAELRELVLKDFGHPADYGFQLSAGGTEALYMLTRALLGAGDEVVASDPSYLIIHKFVELAGAKTLNLDIYRPPYRLTAERVQAAITPKTRMILLIDPLNPLGSGYPREEVRAIAEIAHDRHLWLLNDVTYRDFPESHTLASQFAPEETITVWSVSKNCGIAGLRLGGLMGPKQLVARIARFNTNDLGVNIFAQRAAVELLRTKPQWIDAVLRQTRANQARIRDVVGAVEGTELPVFPSQANMFGIDIHRTGITPERLQEELLRTHGVFLRAGNYLSPAHGGEFIRASFSNSPDDIARFAEAFPRAVESLRPRAPIPH